MVGFVLFGMYTKLSMGLDKREVSAELALSLGSEILLRWGEAKCRGSSCKARRRGSVLSVLMRMQLSSISARNLT